MKVAETSKNLGVSPLQSQVIQNLATQKRCFLGTFFLDNCYFDPFPPNEPPPHDIHRWKAVNLSFPGARPKISFLRPVSRENFGNALGMTSIYYLTVCHSCFVSVEFDRIQNKSKLQSGDETSKRVLKLT